MTPSVPIEGRCEPRFEPVHKRFLAGFESGDVGAGVAVVLAGRVVVDLHGGHTDALRSRPWRRDTLVNVYSTTKGVATLCLHRLVDAGAIDLDAPVARYWPEFAQQDKGAITVRQVLGHRAGVIGFGPELPANQIYDWDTLCAGLARAAPAWRPGERHGYHAKTFGHLVGELVRRVDGRSLGTYLREEITEPLGLDFHVGLRASELERCADLLDPSPEAIAQVAEASPEGSPGWTDADRAESRSFFEQAFGTGFSLEPNRAEWRQAELPASNGHGTALALARLYGALASGGRLDDVQLMSPRALEAATREHAAGPDWVLQGRHTRFALGFFLTPPGIRFGPNPASFGHPGMGGSLAFADPDRGLGFAYVMNQLKPTFDASSQGAQLIDAVYACLA